MMSEDDQAGFSEDPELEGFSEDDDNDNVAGPSRRSYNPAGKNQYKDCPPANDPRLPKIFEEFQRRNITNKEIISKLLLSEHGIQMSSATVTRRRRDFAIKGSGATTREMPETAKRQLLLDQMSKHPSRREGPRRMREIIASETGVLLTRDWITDEMRRHDPEGFEYRKPTSSKHHRTALVSLGPHHEWSADGHDKLSSIGFPIYGFRDVWSALWLLLRVVPNNRLKIVIGYLYLSLVKELGGMPLQSTTDCGSETTMMFGFANALREAFTDLDPDELPAHRFLKSVHNITIERGWIPLRFEAGENIRIYWESGVDKYDESDERQRNLINWIWPPLVQRELDAFKFNHNNHRVRKDKKKLLPSGVTPSVAFALHTEYGGKNCLQPVDVDLVSELMEELGGEDLLRFIDEDYESHASAVFASLEVAEITLENAWHIFDLMLPLV